MKEMEILKRNGLYKISVRDLKKEFDNDLIKRVRIDNGYTDDDNTYVFFHFGNVDSYKFRITSKDHVIDKFIEEYKHHPKMWMMYYQKNNK